MESKIDSKLMTKEVLAKAMDCKTPEEVAALAKENGVELTLDEAKKCLDNLENFDVTLSDDDLQKVAGGGMCWEICHSPGTY